MAKSGVTKAGTDEEHVGAEAEKVVGIYPWWRVGMSMNATVSSDPAGLWKLGDLVKKFPSLKSCSSPKKSFREQSSWIDTTSFRRVTLKNIQDSGFVGQGVGFGIQ